MDEHGSEEIARVSGDLRPLLVVALLASAMATEPGRVASAAEIQSWAKAV